MTNSFDSQVNMPPARGRKKRAPPKLAVVQETAFHEDDEEAAQQQQQDAQTTERDPLQQLRDKLEDGDGQGMHDMQHTAHMHACAHATAMSMKMWWLVAGRSGRGCSSDVG